MDTHKNAPLTPKGRAQMVRAVLERGLSNAAAARQFNTTPKTVGKWVNRFRKEGADGLRDRSSRPLSSPAQTPQATCDAIEILRRLKISELPVVDPDGRPAGLIDITDLIGLLPAEDVEP